MTRPTLLSVAALAVLLLPQAARVGAQDFTSNATSLMGTWTSGTGAVVTGPAAPLPGEDYTEERDSGLTSVRLLLSHPRVSNMDGNDIEQSFADPMNNDEPFFYPSTTGMAYSFTDDGYFEEAQYRFQGNGSQPQCSKAVVIWQHGRYNFHSNGSLTLEPAVFEADGRVQVQDPCAATSKVLTYYNQFTLFNSWAVTIDIHHAAYMLQLTRFDGSLMPRLYLTVRPPTMLPKTSLTAATNGSAAAISSAS